MTRRLSTCSRWAGVVLAMVACAWAAGAIAPRATAAPATKAGAESDLYAKRATWAETMVATRANYARFLDEQKQAANPGGAKPFDSGVVRGGADARQVSLDVTGVKTLRLATTCEEGTGNCHIWGEARLIAKDGTETRLGSLKPVYTRVGWGQLLVDRNWQNNPLRIADREFKYGIWVHSDSDVCYDLGGKYVRFEAWAGLDKDRITGAARFRVLFDAGDPLPAVWQKVAADFPVQSKWLMEDSGRDRHLEWFAGAATTKSEQALLQRVLGQLGLAGEELRKEFDELRRAKAPADDARWLELYGRACRGRDVLAPAQSIGIAELRTVIEGQVNELARAKAPVDDPRWADLQARAARLAATMPDLQGLSLATFGPSVENLAKALPGRFTGGDALRGRLADFEARWQAVFPALAKGDEAALAKVPALADEIKTLRRAVLEGMRGMGEFLASSGHDAQAEWRKQFEALQHDLGNRPHFAKVSAEAFRPESIIQESDRDPADVVLRRTAALLADLKATAAAGRLAPLAKELAELQAANPQIDLKNAEARYALFADASRVRRQIAFANPLVAFDKILFIKRHRAIYNHMCDQYYGMAQRPGGGLYVLNGAFGPSPKVEDVLANSTVQNGRLKGQKLWGGPDRSWNISFDGEGNQRGDVTEGGSFLSPDLSYDGKQILFAYVECRGDPNHRHHTDPNQGHWAEGRSYHVFKVNVDGTNLTQLTDGTWNEFDPCWLPNGRVAFISERRGGYLRCGRTCPTYTLYDMAADGSDINCLSFHETNEWNPSVTHDGRIIYTRWDYVDRFGCTAHHPWITTLDGADSRAVHGNFAPRAARPDMELDTRAIPGSGKYVATAAPHHSQCFGSLVVVNPDVADDDAMGPIKRLTPEVGFPESQGGTETYGMAWPLSEDYHLAVYDADNELRKGGGHYGIYLVDSFGNKELLYRDPRIACMSPIPLRPTAMPPVGPLAAVTAQTKTDSRTASWPGKPGEATIAVLNVYASIRPWPEGTRIKALRVLQVLPMSVPSGRPPHETGVRIALAGDSVVPTRYVLGTVPVEEDGSAHFTVPANREMFFQALDEKGLAVQSMRSATYLHEGERLVCAGCHEPKDRTPLAAAAVPLAMRREPSRLTPDVDGSNPFSYPRLVQPVLERNCLPCHTKNPGKAPNLNREPIQRRWYASYNSLVPFGFTSYGENLRTTPGQFGARASKLYAMLSKGHNDVKLSDEDMHRLTLWLDCSTMFYGVYEKEGGEAQLRGEIVKPTLE